jgi:glycosyltransferase involved in cell wall biosynthesis
VFLSFVIPTYNRSRLLPETIPALAGLKTAEGIAYEVIFVDNGSTDSSPAILQDAVNRFPHIFRYIRIAPTGGPSAPRNTGIRAAKGEVVIIVDDDVLPDDDLVLRHAEFHTRYPEQHQAAVGAAYVPDRVKDDPMSWLHEFNHDRLGNDVRVDYLHFWTCNVSIKRDFMLRAGMFDESFLFYEDVLCGYKLEQNGMHLYFQRNARAQHLHQMTAEGLAVKARFVGRWQYSFLERVGWDPKALIVLHVLSTRLPVPLLVKRCIGRIGFRIADNPLGRRIMELCGARSPKRTRLSDIYYSFAYHRNMIAGYYEAKRNAEAGRPLDLMRLQSQLADRGDR